MDTTLMYIERLEQALRVMAGLSEQDRTHFDITVIAIRSKRGLRACIAGHCGLDPWFQAQGLTTFVDDSKSGSTGDLSVGFGEFFGTCNPFLRSRYPARFADGHEDVSVADAITELKRAIELFKGRHGKAAAELSLS